MKSDKSRQALHNLNPNGCETERHSQKGATVAERLEIGPQILYYNYVYF